MAIEIERKFLVNVEKWNQSDKGTKNLYRQGYILTDPQKTIRVRETDEAGYITIKGLSAGASRLEYEYEIPKRDAAELIDHFCAGVISKIRHISNFSGKAWEVDEFLEENQGLIVAEIELSNEDEAFELPPWIDKEVTGIEKYYNSNLSKNPFSKWK